MGVIPALPTNRLADQGTDEGIPLNRDEEENAKRVEQSTHEGLAESPSGVQPWTKHQQDADRRLGAARGEPQHLPAEQHGRPESNLPRGGHTFAGVLGQAIPHLTCRAVHAAGGDSASVTDVSHEASPAVGPWQRQPVVKRCFHRRVTADSFIRLTSSHEPLTAAGTECRPTEPTHGPQREERKQNPIDERNEQLFENCARLLPRETADQRCIALLEKPNHPCKSVWFESHVGIEEREDVVPGHLREREAGRLLAAPTVRQRRSRFDPQSRILGRDLTNNLGRAVGGMVVEYDYFDFDMLGSEDGFDTGCDAQLLVAGGDENRNRRLT